jgi:hypothetical protein
MAHRMKFGPLISCLCVSLLLSHGASLLVAQDAAPRLPKAEEGSVSAEGRFSPAAREKAATSAAQPVKLLTKDTVAIGQIVVNQQARTVTFPVKLQMREGVIEYALVHTMGKTHESLLTTDVAPVDVHVAALLLNGNGSKPTASVSWKRNGGETQCALSDLIELTTKAPVDGPWAYTGSLFQGQTFAAQREGSLISLIGDPEALMTHSKLSALGRDDLFRPKSSSLPADGVPLLLTLTFPLALDE